MRGIMTPEAKEKTTHNDKEDTEMMTEKMIAKLESKGFRRWSKYGKDRLYMTEQAAGLEISSIQDCTPIPHNGCRPRKRRRV